MNIIYWTINLYDVNRRLSIMDKQIKKVRKDVEKGDKKKAKKDISKLMKMDKNFDKSLDKCGMKHR